jgi:hypothetical protein
VPRKDGLATCERQGGHGGRRFCSTSVARRLLQLVRFFRPTGATPCHPASRRPEQSLRKEVTVAPLSFFAQQEKSGLTELHQATRPPLLQVFRQTLWIRQPGNKEGDEQEIVKKAAARDRLLRRPVPCVALSAGTCPAPPNESRPRVRIHCAPPRSPFCRGFDLEIIRIARTRGAHAPKGNQRMARVGWNCRFP